MSALASRNPFLAVLPQDKRDEFLAREAERRERQSRVMGLAALFGIPQEDAAMIERDFRANPENRRSTDLTKHFALTLRARERFLAPRRKAVAA